MEEGFDGLLRDKTRPSRIAPSRRRGGRARGGPDAHQPADRDDPLDRLDDGKGDRHQCQRRPAHLAAAVAQPHPIRPIKLSTTRSSSTSCATSSGST